jgi:hypothetical protein
MVEASIIVTIFLVLLILGVFIANVVLLSLNGATADSWNDLKPQMIKIWMLGITGLLASFVVIFINFSGDTIGSNVFRVLTCASFFISFCALATAAITKS